MSYKGPSWPWSYGSWISNYLCNQCLSPLMLWAPISIRARCTTLCDKVCQWPSSKLQSIYAWEIKNTESTDKNGSWIRCQWCVTYSIYKRFWIYYINNYHLGHTTGWRHERYLSWRITHAFLLCLFFYKHYWQKTGETYSEICLNWTLNLPKSCINQTLNKVLMQEIFVNLTCINRTPVYSKHKSWSQWGLV